MWVINPQLRPGARDRKKIGFGSLKLTWGMRLPADYSGAQSDEHLIELWLQGRPEQTIKTYRHTALKFLKHLSKKLPEATVADVVAWVKSLEGADSTKTRKVICIKSLISFAEKIGYCVFNVGMALRIPQQRRRLHERILDTETVQALVAAAPEGRDRIYIRFLYGSASRVSESVGINWIDLQKNTVTFHGKGGKTRTVPIPEAIMTELKSLRWSTDTDTSPVFKSIKGHRLSVRDAQRIVKRAREEVTTRQVTPHWMRHAHATHTLDNGAPIHKVQKQLGHANVSTTSLYLHVRGDDGSSQWLNV